MSDSLQPHGLQRARLPCPSPTLRACSDSGLSSQWCHPTITPSVSLFCPALDALGLTLDDRGALILSTNSSGHFTRLIYTTQEDFVHSHLSRFGVYSTSFRRTDSVFPSLPICCCFSLVTKSSPTLYDPLDCSTPGIPVIYNLPESGRREWKC